MELTKRVCGDAKKLYIREKGLVRREARSNFEKSNSDRAQQHYYFLSKSQYNQIFHKRFSIVGIEYNRIVA